MKFVKHGSTSIGIKTNEGVILAVEKKIISKLMEPAKSEKLVEIDKHCACSMSRIIARVIIHHARVESKNHKFSSAALYKRKIKNEL